MTDHSKNKMEKKVHSILLRVRKTIQEDAYIAVPVDEKIVRINENGENELDTNALIAEALNLSKRPGVQWKQEEISIQAHPIQRPIPTDREKFDPLD